MGVNMIKSNKTRLIVAIGGAVLVASALLPIISPTPANAARYCLRSTSGHNNCGFRTMAQCQDTRHGKGGMCYRKPGS